MTYKLKIDMFLRAPIVLEFENCGDGQGLKQDIEYAMRRNNLIHLNSEHGYQGEITINPVYIRTIEVMEE